MVSSSSCPDWFQPFASHVRQNAALYRSIAVVCAFVGHALVGSVFLATLAPGVYAVQALILVALSGCRGEAALRELAAQAVLGCDVVLLVCGAVSVPLVVSVVATLGLTLPGVMALAPFAALFGALRVVLAPLAGGRPPTTGAVVGLTGALGAFAGVDVSGLQRVLQYGIGEADRQSGSALRRKAGGDMTILDATKTYLRVAVQQPTREALVASSSTIRAASAAAVAGDFRPLVVEVAKTRAKAIASQRAVFAASGQVHRLPETDAALRFLDAVLKTPKRRWGQRDALAVVNDPARGATVGSTVGSGLGDAMKPGKAPTGPRPPSVSIPPPSTTAPSSSGSSVVPLVAGFLAFRFLF